MPSPSGKSDACENNRQLRVPRVFLKPETSSTTVDMGCENEGKAGKAIANITVPMILKI
jgi:hypothetical protein